MSHVLSNTNIFHNLCYIKQFIIIDWISLWIVHNIIWLYIIKILLNYCLWVWTWINHFNMITIQLQIISYIIKDTIMTIIQHGKLRIFACKQSHKCILKKYYLSSHIEPIDHCSTIKKLKTRTNISVYLFCVKKIPFNTKFHAMLYNMFNKKKVQDYHIYPPAITVISLLIATLNHG